MYYPMDLEVGPWKVVIFDGPTSMAMIGENRQLVTNEPVEFEK